MLLLRNLSTTKCLIYLQSGRQYEVPQCILVDEGQRTLTKKMTPKPVFVYQMICTTNNS